MCLFMYFTLFSDPSCEKGRQASFSPSSSFQRGGPWSSRRLLSSSPIKSGGELGLPTLLGISKWSALLASAPGNCEIVNEFSEMKTSPVTVLHCNLVLVLRIDPGFPDHVPPGPENLLLKKMYAQFSYFFIQINQVLGMKTGGKVRHIISQTKNFEQIVQKRKNPNKQRTLEAQGGCGSQGHILSGVKKIAMESERERPF